MGINLGILTSMLILDVNVQVTSCEERVFSSVGKMFMMVCMCERRMGLEIT